MMDEQINKEPLSIRWLNLANEIKHKTEWFNKDSQNIYAEAATLLFDKGFVRSEIVTLLSNLYQAAKAEVGLINRGK